MKAYGSGKWKAKGQEKFCPIQRYTPHPAWDTSQLEQRPSIPAKRPKRCLLKGLALTPAGRGVGKESRRFRLQPIVLLLEHGAAEQLIDTLAGRSFALGRIDVLVDIGFDGEALSQSHSLPRIFDRIRDARLIVNLFFANVGARPRCCGVWGGGKTRT